MGTITKTIGTAARDYSTLQAWEDALPANLVTDGNSQVGQCFNDSEFTFTGTGLTIAGETTDATHTITLTCGTGQSFRDNANVQTNALRYNATNGAGIRKTGGYNMAVDVQVANVFFSGLQIKEDTGRIVVQTPNGFQASNCIFQHAGSAGAAVIAGDGQTLLNVLVIRDSSDTTAAVSVGYGANTNTIEGCTIVRPSNNAAAGTAVHRGGSGGTCTMKNTAIFGFTTISDSATWTANNNATDQSAIGFGSSNQVSLTYATEFQDPSATKDFRINSGHAASAGLCDNGATISALSPDIAGTSRPSGTAYDIGCWELVQGTTDVLMAQIWM